MAYDEERKRQAAAAEIERRRRALASSDAEAAQALTQLDEGERRALRGQLPRTFKEALSPQHEEKFKRLGLIERKLGGLVLTSKGELAAKRLPSW
jgi:hypothetical protein